MNQINKKNWMWHLWDIIYPLLFYYAVLMFSFTAAKVLLGNETSMYMYCQIIASAITLPVMYFNFYRVLYRKPREQKRQIGVYVAIIPIILCLSIALNNIIMMSPLVDISDGYREAASNFYGSVLLLEIIGSGILTPILEELVFRGIVYGKLRSIMNMPVAIAISALLFAIIHFNVVQFVYAFFVGALLAIFIELTHDILSAIIGHMVANIFAVLRTEFDWITFMVDRSVVAWITSVGLLVLGIILLFIVMKKGVKRDTI